MKSKLLRMAAIALVSLVLTAQVFAWETSEDKDIGKTNLDTSSMYNQSASGGQDLGKDLDKGNSTEKPCKDGPNFEDFPGAP